MKCKKKKKKKKKFSSNYLKKIIFNYISNQKEEENFSYWTIGIYVYLMLPKNHNIILKTNADLLIKWPTFSRYIDFPQGFCINFLNIHCWFNIINIISPSPNDGWLVSTSFLNKSLVLLELPSYQFCLYIKYDLVWLVLMAYQPL